MVVSNLVGHCIKHVQYSSNVAHVITSVANYLFNPKECAAWHSKLASDRHNTELIGKCAFSCYPSDGTFKR